MRQGQLLALRWEHINVKARIAHLPETKNSSKRDVPLTLEPGTFWRPKVCSSPGACSSTKPTDSKARGAVWSGTS
ncbi:hypothetical protein [Cupriavidus sp. KK10]|uniref:hypothetical protein n=1 Tax=Cupriavidus sp. KK10 TaxID=1478019 RepID=UPI002012B31B|nr:hypothetical protein [Cupriavidus sp. KK10]